MVSTFKINSRLPKWWRLFFITILCAVPSITRAHPSPNSLVFLDISPDRVSAELQLPLPELELAFGNNISRQPEKVIALYEPQLKEYLKAHIHPYVTKGLPWLVEVTDMKMDKGTPIDNGPLYWEVIAHVVLKPQPGENTRAFYFDYDVIVHQVINHVAFVSVRNDWENGIAGEKAVEPGIIKWNMKNNVIYPLEINLQKGSWWKGCSSMLTLGMQHIKEGTDHLLFIIMLLLPAMLVTNGKQWGGFGGTGYGIMRLLKIVTAFTIGHSITLMAGALNWFQLPSKPVEILIGFSILVSAIHALRPLFPGREAWVAAGFGLIHGLAFAGVLAHLQLSGLQMGMSILSFNMGIELMQLAVIAITVPWLILLSRTTIYTGIRITGALLSAVAALAWITERASEQANPVSRLVQKAAPYAPWAIVTLAVLSVVVFLREKNKIRSSVFKKVHSDVIN